jgi:hypothetical protein
LLFLTGFALLEASPLAPFVGLRPWGLWVC